MKYFTFILFLFSALILNAQINMEEISYIPSPSGYYNNLIVKGNTHISKVETKSFNVQSYASILNLNISTETSKLFVQRIYVSTTTGGGTVALFSEFPANVINSWNIVNPEQLQSKSDPSDEIVSIKMNSGNLSVAKSNNNDADLIIEFIEFPDATVKSPSFEVRTYDLNYAHDALTWEFDPDDNYDLGFMPQSIYIMGMKVPECKYTYHWQNIQAANGQYFTILACGSTNCSNWEEEEPCLQAGKNWVITGNGTFENPYECTCS